MGHGSVDPKPYPTESTSSHHHHLITDPHSHSHSHPTHYSVPRDMSVVRLVRGRRLPPRPCRDISNNVTSFQLSSGGLDSYLRL